MEIIVKKQEIIDIFHNHFRKKGIIIKSDYILKENSIILTT